MPSGWALGTAIRSFTPLTGLAHFVAECILWIVVVALACLPMASGRFRRRLEAMIPN
jgi:hypothetical protein